MLNHEQEKLRPKVGVGVMLLRDGMVLLGRRRGSNGEGEYAFPGGHLEFGESFDECARREVLEETGLGITNIRFQFVANVTKYPGKHYAHIGLIAEWSDGEARNLEPEKNDDWDWYPIDNPPHPLFLYVSLAIESYKTGKNYFDSL